MAPAVTPAIAPVSPPVSPPVIAPVTKSGGADARMSTTFDTCHTGVVMRALLFVEAVLALGSVFAAADLFDWLARLSVLTAGAFPATLGWLVLVCLSKTLLARWTPLLQMIFGAIAGALAGLAAVIILSGIGFAAPGWPVWLGGSGVGALISALLVTWLASRARASSPAAERARLSDLQTRIRPHFLFNTLNSAIALVRADPPRAERLLEDLSDLFRAALEDERMEATLDDEVALAQRYLAIEQARFGERLRMQWLLDPGARGTRLPRLLLQPLLENAVRHGVEPSEQGATIELRTRRSGDRVFIEVSNTMPAGSGDHGHGIGLASVRERLALMYDVQARFEAGPQGDSFRVRIELPAAAAAGVTGAQT